MDLTPVSQAEMFIDRLELGPDAKIHFLRSDENSGYALVKTFTQDDHWSISGVANLYINVDFVRLNVQDYPGFEQDVLVKTEAILFEGVTYKLVRKYRPIGLNRVWQFKIEVLSEFQTIPGLT